ncbi:hypothetical protein HUJ04_009917 [Dendroctonus ponderosae]|nr:hypothetical protein HUJ04_009917 [Dendroctonus ponderosae]
MSLKEVAAPRDVIVEGQLFLNLLETFVRFLFTSFAKGCGFCGKSVDENSSVISSSAVFCSELCFSQSRRASFKRNKTCDWCRLARHTVSYVDCQDNAAQLQFCSEKCLNQYKMNIFCRETQAHLELHPHLHGAESTSSGLITPDLWLKNCTSPSSNNRSSPVLSPIGTNPSSQSFPRNLTVNSKPEHVPLISVAPSSKLLANDVKRNRTKVSKRFKKSCPSTITSLGAATSFNDIPQDLRVRQTPPLDEVPVETYAFKSSPKDDAKQVRSSLEENIDSQKNDGSLIFKEGGASEEIKRSSIAKEAITKLTNIWRSHKISLATKMRLLLATTYDKSGTIMETPSSIPFNPLEYINTHTNIYVHFFLAEVIEFK